MRVLRVVIVALCGAPVHAAFHVPPPPPSAPAHGHARELQVPSSLSQFDAARMRPVSTGTRIGRLFSSDEGKPNITINHAEPKNDTIRVRIWRALASGDELCLTQLCKQVGERRGDVRSHLTHVERQAKTIRNKSDEWRVRRGLLPLAKVEGGDNRAVYGAKKLRLKSRRGAKNELFVRLV